MKTIYLSILATLLFTACNSTEWWVGGTLHAERVSAWKKATAENKLATCADMLVAIRQQNNATYANKTDLKIDAEKVVKCINEKVQAGAADTTKIAALAVECVVDFKAGGMQ